MSIITLLNAEWTVLAEAPWDSPEPPFGGCVNAGAVLARISDTPHECFRALITRAQRADTLAGRIVVQALLPGIIVQARKAGHEVDEHISALWPVIMTAHAETGASTPFAILAEVAHQVRLRRKPLRPLIAYPATPRPKVAQLLEHARHSRALTPTTSRILHEIYVDEIPRYEVARRYSLTEHALSQRCSAATKSLQKLVA